MLIKPFRDANNLDLSGGRKNLPFSEILKPKFALLLRQHTYNEELISMQNLKYIENSTYKKL